MAPAGEPVGATAASGPPGLRREPQTRFEVGFEPRPASWSEVEPGTEVAVAPTVGDGWLAAWSAIERRADAGATRRAVLDRIPGATGYAVATAGGAPVGVGLAVAERGWAGLFCTATDPGFRRRGVARAVVGALTEGARRAGAERLYLQVEQGNVAAQALYAGLGFRRSHGYHYRTAP